MSAAAAAPARTPPEARALSGRLEDGTHRLWLRVYYEDTDAAGIVYHASYLRFAERARTEMLRLVDVHQSRLMAQAGLTFAVKDCAVDYRRPAHLDDLLEVRSRIVDLGRVQLTLDQRVTAVADARVCAVLTVRVGCLNRDGRPARMPAAVADAMKPLVASLE